MRLSEAVDELLIATRVAGRSDRTVQDYAEKTARLVDFLGDKEIEQVALSDLRRFVDDLTRRSSRFQDHPNRAEKSGGLSVASVAAYVRVVRRLFSFLYEDGLIEQNPALKLKVPKPPRDRPKAISTADFHALLKAIDTDTVVGKRDRALILLLADSGCRVGGLVRLDVEDVDLERCRVLLREKGGKMRYGFFSSLTKRALIAWLEVRPTDKSSRLFVSLGTRGEAHLTVRPARSAGRTGRRLDAGRSALARPNSRLERTPAWALRARRAPLSRRPDQGVREMLKRLKRRAGVKGPVNPHAFRHGFAREYLSNGGNLASLADTMGHSNVNVTWQAYAVFTTDELKAAHARYSPVAQLELDGIV